jgi:hypothetical protein
MESNLEKAVDFYKQLGFTLIFHIKERWAEFELNGVKLGLCPTLRDVVEFRTGIVFEVKDLRTLYEKTKDGFAYQGEPSEAVHGIMVSLKDPGGNIIDFYQSTPEKVKVLLEKTIEEKAALENPVDSCCRKEKVTCCKV